MSWPETVIWWHVYPLGFGGAEPQHIADGEIRHRLPGEAWLDYLLELGANGLALGPIFSSESHGYDTTDHFAVDPRLGDLDDVDALIAAAHARGIRVLLDGVFNHVGRGHPRFRQALTEGPESESGPWFRLERDGDHVRAESFEGHDQLVVLNHDHPAVIDYVVEVMNFWLDRGADGWRLDAAYAVPAGFWAAVLPRVRDRHPDAWFVGEMIHGDYAGYVAESGLDSITQYELWKSTWSSLKEHNLFELDWTIGRHEQLLQSFVPMTFLGNHDVTRLASQIEDARLIPHAVALLFLLPGVPSIYYGDELGLRAVKEERFGGDDAIRPQFPAEPADLEPADVEAYPAYRRMISLRRRHPWLVDARVEVGTLTNEQLAVTATSRAGSDRLLLLLNLSDEPASLALPDGDFEPVDASEGFRDDRPNQLPAFGWAVLAERPRQDSNL